jgi:hypothetical protein
MVRVEVIGLKSRSCDPVMSFIFGDIDYARGVLEVVLQRCLSRIRGLNLRSDLIRVYTCRFFLALANLVPGPTCEQITVLIEGLCEHTEVTEELCHKIEQRVRSSVSEFVESYNFAEPKHIEILIARNR